MVIKKPGIISMAQDGFEDEECGRRRKGQCRDILTLRRDTRRGFKEDTCTNRKELKLAFWEKNKLNSQR